MGSLVPAGKRQWPHTLASTQPGGTTLPYGFKLTRHLLATVRDVRYCADFLSSSISKKTDMKYSRPSVKFSATRPMGG